MKILCFFTGMLIGGLIIFAACQHRFLSQIETGHIAFTNRHYAIYKIDINDNRKNELEELITQVSQ